MEKRVLKNIKFLIEHNDNWDMNYHWCSRENNNVNSLLTHFLKLQTTTKSLIEDAP